MARARTRIGVCVVALLFAPSVWAQGAPPAPAPPTQPEKPDESQSPERVAAAKTLFDQAQAAMDAKNYTEACAKFRASNDAVPRLGTLLNLANCHDLAGNAASAWGAYVDAINLAKKLGRADYEAFAEQKKAALEPRLSRLAVTVPPDVKLEGMTITRDGLTIDAGAWGVPLPVDPGVHVIEVTAPHKLRFKGTVKVAGEHQSVEFKVPKLEDAPVAWPSVNQPRVVERVVEIPSPFTPLRVGGIVAGSIGVVGVALGVVFGLVANDKYQSALRTNCNNDPNACSPAGVTAGATAHDLASVATGFFIGGLVAVGAGVTLFILGAPSSHAPESPSALRLRVTPVAGGAAASLGGAF
jgi:hypothetical protein